jgi:hypothetical protein
MYAVVRRSAALGGAGAGRLDAEFFDPVAERLEQRLGRSGGRPLSTIAEIVDERIDPGKQPGDFNYAEIGAVDVRDGFILTRRLAAGEAPSRARVRIQKDHVLISSVRPARNQVTYAFRDLDGAIASTGLIDLRSRSSDLPPEVLFAFLKTEAARQQLVRRARASMYPALNPPEVLDIVVPQFGAKAVKAVVQLIHEAAKARASYLLEAEQARATAKSYFEGLVDPAVLGGTSESVSHVRKRGEVFANAGARIDAEFHAPVFERALGRLQAQSAVKPLGFLCERVMRGRSPAASAFSETDLGGPAILKLAALSGDGINWPAVMFAPADWEITEGAQLKEGDVLLNSTAHEPNYIGHRVDVIGQPPSDLHDRLTFVADLLCLRLAAPEETPPHYVAAFMRSPLGREQLKRCIRGVRAHIYPDDVANHVFVPVPPSSISLAITKASEVAERERWRYSERIRSAVDLLDSAVGPDLN